jgi:hypothetical protein
MYDGVDTIVLFEELAYEEAMPLRWLAYSEPVTEAVRRSFAERNLKLLQTSAVLDEHVQADKSDERSPFHADIIRMDMKISLLLDVMGHLLARDQPLPEPVPVRFNALGAIWKDASLKPVEGSRGVMEIHLRRFFVDPLRFAGQLVAVSDAGLVKVQFDNPGEAVADLIEKLAFRRHRRHVAARKPGRES